MELACLSGFYSKLRCVNSLSKAGLLVLGLFLSGSALGVTLEVKQSNGEPAQGVVVTLANDATSSAQPGIQEMGQRKRQFDPHILIVQKGATVSFPNYDDIKHHVYSFSVAGSFEKELYKGRESTPETFNTEGVIELGCNVHDWMLGYIYITDTPLHGRTDEQGILTLPDVPAGDYEITVWHPKLDNDSNTETMNASIAGNYRIVLQASIAEDDASEFEFDFEDY